MQEEHRPRKDSHLEKLYTIPQQTISERKETARYSRVCPMRRHEHRRKTRNGVIIRTVFDCEKRTAIL